MSVTAIVPMRHDSERVKGKNYRPLGGLPLYHHVLRTLLSSEAVHRVVIDTDSDLIAEDAAAHFPQVRVVPRPPHLTDGAIPMNDVLLNTVAGLDGELFLQTHSTNPFLRASTVDAAVQRFCDSLPRNDSLFGVTRIQARLWRADGSAVNHDPETLLRTQDLEPVFLENSTLYLFTRDVLRRRHNRVGASPLLFEVDPVESLDIDTEDDFRLAERLWAASGLVHEGVQ